MTGETLPSLIRLGRVFSCQERMYHIHGIHVIQNLQEQPKRPVPQNIFFPKRCVLLSCTFFLERAGHALSGDSRSKVISTVSQCRLQRSRSSSSSSRRSSSSSSSSSRSSAQTVPKKVPKTVPKKCTKSAPKDKHGKH